MYPKEWELISFVDTLVKNDTGKKNQIKKSEISEIGKYPVMDQGQKFVSGFSDRAEKVYSPKEPVIIFGDHTRCFKYIDFPFILGADGTKVLSPNTKKYDPKFYYYALNNLDIPSKGYNRHFKLLKEKKIVCPPLPEQRNIAYVLSKIQSAIELQEKIIKTTTELKKALMQKLFTEGLHNEPQKETEIGLVPESWEVVELGSLSENPKYGFTDSAAVKGIVKFLRITDIQENGVNWETVPFCNCPKDKIPNYLLKDKDIVFARIGATTGKSYIINDPPDAVFASYLIRLRVLSSTDADYLYYFFGTNEYWEQVDSHKGNNVKGGVNSSLLKKMKIPLPKDVKEQKEIAGILKSIDMKHNLAVRHQELFLSLFKTMLHNLMTGQIRVKDMSFN